jgi:hypothetical protein
VPLLSQHQAILSFASRLRGIVRRMCIDIAAYTSAGSPTLGSREGMASEGRK